MKCSTAVVATTVPATLEKFMHEYILQLEAAGFRPVLISSPGRPWDSLRVNYPKAGVVELNMARELTPIRDILALGRWLWRLWRIQPRLMIAMTPKAALLSMLAGWLTGVPSRLYLSGGLRLESERGVRRFLLAIAERVTCACATDVVVNSPSLMAVYVKYRLCSAQKLRQTSPGSSHGVDARYFDYADLATIDRAPLGLDPNLLTFAFIGRLTRDKGLDTFIRASNLLAEGGLRHQLLIVGPHDEPDSNRYVTALKSMPVPTLLTGPVPDVRPYLAATDVLALPSRREGFPNVVLEAAAMSVPSIVSDATGCVDSVVDGVTGIIVPVDDASALAEALLQLSIDSQLRRKMGAEARAWVSTEFHPATIVSGVLAPALEAF